MKTPERKMKGAFSCDKPRCFCPHSRNSSASFSFIDEPALQNIAAANAMKTNANTRIRLEARFRLCGVFLQNFAWLDRLSKSAPHNVHRHRRKEIGLLHSLLLHANAELIACTNYLAVFDHEFKQFFALHLAAGFVLQRRHNLLRPHINDLARGRISESAIHAEANPADTIPDLNAGDLLRRHHSCIEHVYGVIRTVREPKFLLVRSQSDSMTRACVTLDGTLRVARNLHMV